MSLLRPWRFYLTCAALKTQVITSRYCNFQEMGQIQSQKKNSNSWYLWLWILPPRLSGSTSCHRKVSHSRKITEISNNKDVNDSYRNEEETEKYLQENSHWYKEHANLGYSPLGFRFLGFFSRMVGTLSGYFLKNSTSCRLCSYRAWSHMPEGYGKA